MTERVFFHIGAPKTGTTYLQTLLLANRARLKKEGVLYVGKRFKDHVHANMAVRESPRLETLTAKEQRAWKRLVRETHAWRGHTAILSHEFFGAATAEQARRALEALSPAEVHLVFTTRDFASQLRATWQEQLKYAMTTPLEEWWPCDSEEPSTVWGWRSLDPVSVLPRWTADLDPTRVHVVTVPPLGVDEEELWRRFATACGIEPTLAQAAKRRPNQSLGAVEAELLRRVNNHLAAPIDTPQETARWVRGVLARRILAPRAGSRFELSEAQLERVRPRTEAQIAFLRASRFNLYGSIDDLQLPAPSPTVARPDAVADEQLVEVASETMATMLLHLRERAHDADRMRHERDLARRERDLTRRQAQEAAVKLEEAKARLKLLRGRLTATQDRLRDTRAALAKAQTSREPARALVGRATDPARRTLRRVTTLIYRRRLASPGKTSADLS